jgi:hypothetical protein
MSYRPVCDVWILGRPKVKYYGAFPAGFLGRARLLLGAGRYDPVLHVCSGKIREYKCGPSCKPGHWHGFGVHDRTLDLDPTCFPDYKCDAREPFPFADDCVTNPLDGYTQWKAILIDRPYTEPDADHYAPGRAVLPEANLLAKNGISAVDVGGRVGILDYVWPMPPKNAREVALVAVGTGRNNRARWFTVFERIS